MTRILYCVVLSAYATVFVGMYQARTSSSEVHRLFLEDQKDREGPIASLDWEKISPRDQSRRQRVHEILAAGGLKTAQDFHDAAYIYQHGEDASDFLFAHILGMMAVQKGDRSSLWISAATLDRYLKSVQQSQVFGTQYNSINNGPYTQDPYNRILIPDALRLAFCVPDLEQQQKNIAEFNAGKYPEAGLAPAGCTR
jgi:hypothetical protein